jgi:hypothetical protein
MWSRSVLCLLVHRAARLHRAVPCGFNCTVHFSLTETAREYRHSSAVPAIAMLWWKGGGFRVSFPRGTPLSALAALRYTDCVTQMFFAKSVAPLPRC